MALTLEQLEFLAGAGGIEAMELDLPDDPLGAQTRLRKKYSYDEACAIGHMRELRKRSVAGAKFSRELAGKMLLSDELLQQCSSLRLANYVGRRMAEIARGVGRSEVMDLCCGLGGDAIGLASAGLNVLGYDISPQAIVCSEHNAGVAGMGDRTTFTAADVTKLDIPSDAIVHIDPDRRSGGRRVVGLSELRPGEEFLRRLAENTAGGAMKLSAAMDFSELDDWSNVRLEYVSEDGVCKQLVVWWSPDSADTGRTATAVWGDMNDPQSESIASDAPPAPFGEVGPWLIEPGPEVIAAHAVDALAARDNLWRAYPGMLWMFGSEPVDSHLCRSYEIIETVSGREREIRIALKKLGAGLVEIKSRGVSINTDALQRRLRGKGDKPLVVLWTRMGDKQKAFIGVRRKNV
ncbi:MAG: class I SAM-dependent methyltransferase [Phycisphaerae bacterium]|nr:class I SAM-dependent methyltransferase [Phycisphaerae bacterium]MDP7288328.1 class I SAM-dependent methyltransferase [Phycisphaerae bacterium]